MPFAGYQVDEGPLGAWEVDVDCVLLAWNRASGRMEQKRRRCWREGLLEHGCDGAVQVEDVGLVVHGLAGGGGGGWLHS